MRKQVLSFALVLLMSVSVMISGAALQEDVSIETVIAPAYEEACDFRNGYAAVKQDGKWGLIDEAGNMVIAPEYEWMGDYSEGVVLAAKPSNRTGYYENHCLMYLVNLEGKAVQLYETSVVYRAKEDEGIVSELLVSKSSLESGRAGLVCHEGVVVVSGNVYLADGTNIRAKKIGDTVGKNGADVYYNDCTAIGPCLDGLIPMRAIVSPYAGGHPFLMDKAGNIVQVINLPDENAEAMYEYGVVIYAPDHDRIVVSVTSYSANKTVKQFGALDRTGKWIIPLEYDNFCWIPSTATIFSEGIWTLSKDGRWGAVDVNGNVVIPFAYDLVDCYSEGMTVLELDGKCCYADMTGQTYAIPGISTDAPNVTQASRFVQGYSSVYDQASGKAYLVKKAADGSMKVVSGSEKLPLAVYFSGYNEGGQLGSLRSAEDLLGLIPYEENGKWGYQRLVMQTHKPGTPMGDVLYTDIVAYIDDHAIRSYNIAGNTYIVVEDLMAYGFDVQWLPTEGKLVVGTTRTAAPSGYTTTYVPEKNTHPGGTVAMQYLYTNITAWLGDKQVTGYNIGGYTCIGMDDLAAVFATNYVWDAAAGALRLYTQP